MAIFKIDKLKSKKEVVSMIIRGNTLKEITNYIKSNGEMCSKSSIDRYIKQKFIEGHIYANGMVMVKEKEGHLIREIKYPSIESENENVEIVIYNNKSNNPI